MSSSESEDYSSEEEQQQQKPKQVNACYVYDITIPVNEEEWEEAKDEVTNKFNEIAKKWCFQLEKGEEDGYVHFQCRISLKTKLRLPQVIKLLKDIGGHISVTNNKSKNDDFYVMKAKTRIAGAWSDRDPEIPEHLKDTPEWYNWQLKVLEIIKKNPHPRKVYVIVDLDGNKGKSFLMLWLMVRGKMNVIPAFENFKDSMRWVCTAKQNGNAYCIDIPRALDKKKMKEMYGAVEAIKTGYVFDERYTPKSRLFPTPHVFVMTNEEPAREWLSADRWVIMRI